MFVEWSGSFLGLSASKVTPCASVSPLTQVAPVCQQCFQRTVCHCRAAVILLIGIVYRIKYYFAWTVSEAALIFSGFCFNGFDEAGRPRWDRYSNSRIRHVEFSTSLAELPVHWNTCTGNFLRRCECRSPCPKAACVKVLATRTGPVLRVQSFVFSL